MKSTILALAGALVFVISASGCVQFQTAVCTADQYADFPGLEGNYQFNGYNTQTATVQHQAVTIQHASTGVYQSSGSPAQGCWIGTQYVLQSMSEQGHNEIFGLRATPDGSLVTMTEFATDPNLLTQAGVPFQLISVSANSQFHPHDGTTDNSYEVLVDNTNLSAATILSYLSPIGVEFTLQRVE